MYAASREALEQVRQTLRQKVAPDASSVAPALTTGAELFEAVDVLDAERTLRVAVADASASEERRRSLVDGVFAATVSETTLAVLHSAASAHWSAPADLRDGLVTVAREAFLIAAEAQGQLETVEEELFRLSTIVADNPELEQRLAERTVPATARRDLLAKVVYGKVTAVTEALASQAVARPQGMPADDIATLSELAAARRSRTVAEVTSSTSMSDEQKDRLARQLSEVYGGEFSLHEKVDPDLLGGFVVRVGDEVLDGSTRSRLDKVRRTFA